MGFRSTPWHAAETLPANSSDNTVQDAGSHANVSTRTTKPGQPSQKAIQEKLNASDKMCPSLRLIIAAYIRCTCISRQIDVVYQNPGAAQNCGRCSSCCPRPVPPPRDPRSSSNTMASPSTDATLDASSDTEDSSKRWQRLTAKDVSTEKLKDGPKNPEFRWFL